VRDQLSDIDRLRAQGWVLFDAEMSEEGGRFYHSRSRYMIIEVGDDYPDQEPDGFRWATVPQITWLLQHRHYLNVQARSLIACLRALRGLTGQYAGARGGSGATSGHVARM
jgi:oxidase EvaA